MKLENWQSRYESNDIPWDKGSAAPAISQVDKQLPNLLASGTKVLVPGCGLGRDAVEIAAKGCCVTGVDIAPLAVQRATTLAPEGLDVTFLEADLLEPKEGLLSAFDVIWEHTCFCALPPALRRSYVESMWRMLRPNGCLVGVFFINPDEEEQGPPYKASREEICAVFGSHFRIEWEQEPSVHYDGREGREWLMLFHRLDETR